MARVILKPLAQQVVVLTGGTSGIGLVTARMLAQRGARLFLIARNEDALKKVCQELRAQGARAEYAVADVADKVELSDAADKAVAAFGGFDTWVNDAGAFIYGRLDTVALEDQRRLFDVTYWGSVHGTLIAGERLKRTGRRHHQRWQRAGRSGHSVSGCVLRGKVCDQGVYRGVQAGGGSRTSADFTDADQACCHQHTVYRSRTQPDGFARDAQSAAGL